MRNKTFISKLISILLISALMISIAGCAKKKEEKQPTNNDTTTKNATDNNGDKEEPSKEVNVTYPLEEEVELTVWMSLDSVVKQNYTNFGETPMAKALEEATDVKVKYIHPAGGQTEEQFNLMIASGEFPDIIEYDLIKHYPGGPEKAIADGFIVDLTDYIPTYAPDLYQYYQDNPDVDKLVKTDLGQYYNFPFIRGDKALTVYYGPIVRKDWLDDLGLEEPETMDDWYNMLKAFKDKKGAVAPLSFEKLRGIDESKGSPFVGAYGITTSFYVENGEVHYGPIEPKFKDFLTEFSKWYKEGLIDPDFLSIGKKQLSAKMTNGESGAALGTGGSRMSAWLRAMKDDPNYELIGTKFPVLNKGDLPNFSHVDFRYRGTGAFITSSCKNVEAAVKYMNYAYSKEGSLLFNFGNEGKTYEMVDGKPKWTQWKIDNPVEKSTYLRSSYNGPFVQDYAIIQPPFEFPTVSEGLKKWNISDTVKERLPKVTPSGDETEEVAMLFTEIKRYQEEMIVKFILGQESLDNFDQYVENMKSMGIDRVIEIYSSAYDRFNKR